MNDDFLTDPTRGCAPGKADPDLFFSENLAALNRAKDICEACPVRVACDEYAYREGIDYGIWGGINRSPNASKARRRSSEQKAAQRRGAEAAERRAAVETAVRERWETGASDGSIAVVVGVHPSTVQKIRTRLGLTTHYGPHGKRLETAR